MGVVVSAGRGILTVYCTATALTCYEFREGRGENSKGEERKGWYVGWSAVSGACAPHPPHSILRNLYDVRPAVYGSIYDRPLHTLTKYPITAAILTLKRDSLPFKLLVRKTKLVITGQFVRASSSPLSEARRMKVAFVITSLIFLCFYYFPPRVKVTARLANLLLI